MRLSLLPALMLCVISAQAQQAPTDKPAAPDPAKIAQIEELLSLLHVDEMQKQVMSQVETAMGAQIDKSVLEMQVRPEDREKVRADIQDFEKQAFALMSDRIKFERLKPDLIKIYDESFSTDELAAITAFYKSPAGQALIQKLPNLTAKSATLGFKLMQDAMPDRQRMTVEWTNRMKEKYGAPAAK